MPKLTPRGWQVEALNEWERANHRGIVSVVTGGGKTVFALACIDRIRPKATLIVVPTAALLEQWWEEAANYFDLDLDEINVITSTLRFRLGAINIAVLNTAAKLAGRMGEHSCFLIVDECHKAASEYFRAALSVKSFASLGLSATPERPYDDGLHDVLIPALGSVIFSYGYADALHDGVIVPFQLKNIVFELEEERQAEYEKLSKAIARSISRYGAEADETVALFLRRARVLNLSLNRIRLALKLVAANRGKRALVFHEDIEACDLIHAVLTENGVKSGVYHSKMPLRAKAAMLGQYRKGEIDVLVTCRALDEGFNVPETEVGIIAASTATQRQRIQRLGRVVRPAQGKKNASIYTLVATGPEIDRLKEEEERLDGVATVTWSRA
ncbi:DEAD/DEAH box helicase [Cupriavidus sp. USMAHM13]|uniref:DEAD/DEAH box helicase n=1 Tax=Cupriavidus sp. USMAHM13 TaxID=1389192 RepID=UPI0009F517FB|nr:DEAD/DEAH box helicase [Cupriavidus sp. USMAHM13]